MAAIPDIERAALIALYNSTNGDWWKENSGWKNNYLEQDGFSEIGSEGSWKGVDVNENNDHVFALNLHGNQLTGTIPVELGNLTNLWTRAVFNNKSC